MFQVRRDRRASAGEIDSTDYNKLTTTPKTILEIFVRILTNGASETIFRVEEAEKLMGLLDGFRHEDLSVEVFTSMQSSIWSQPAPEGTTEWQEFFEEQGKAVTSLYMWLDGAYSYMFTKFGTEDAEGEEGAGGGGA
jgi:hypothetical protein